MKFYEAISLALVNLNHTLLEPLTSEKTATAAWTALLSLPHIWIPVESRTQPVQEDGEQQQQQQRQQQQQQQRQQQQQQPAESDMPSKRAIKKAKKLIASNQCSKAMQALNPSAKAVLDESTLASLASLHPADPLRLGATTIAEPIDSIVITVDCVQECLKRLDPLSATGVSGWSFELIKAHAFSSPEAVKAWRDLIDIIANSRTPHCDHILASRLIVLSKPNGGVRPIAVGECIFRFISKTISLVIKKAMPQILAPIQFGVGVSCGTETIIHELDRLFHESEDSVICQIDIKNAFNSVSREAIRAAIEKYFPALMPFFRWAYARHSYLVIDDSHQIMSRCGVRQGDPLGPALFALAIHSALVDLNNHWQVRVLAYLDDAHFVGTRSNVQNALAELQTRLSDIGLHLNTDKLAAARDGAPRTGQHSSIVVDSVRIPINSSLSVLGSAIGNAEQVRASAQDKIRKVYQTADRIISTTQLSMQERMVLLRLCVSAQLNHLGRCFHPDAIIHDHSATYTWFLRVLNMDPLLRLPPEDMDIFELPMRLGGNGWKDPLRTSDVAYVASVAQSAVNLRSDLLWNSTPILQTLQTTACRIEPEFRTAFMNALDQPRAQSAMSGIIDNQTHARLQRHFAALATGVPSDRKTAARLFAITTPEAACVFSVPPTRPELVIPDSVFPLIFRFRHGLDVLSVPLAVNYRTCLLCNGSSTLDGTHPHTCKKVKRGVVRRHNNVCSVVRKILLLAGNTSLIEPPMEYDERNSRRADVLAIYDSQARWFDVVVSHPQCPSEVRQPIAQRACADRHAKTKIASFERINHTDPTVLFVPLAFESFGCFGTETLEFVESAAKRAEGVGLNRTAAKLLFTRALSVSVQVGSAKLFLDFQDRLISRGQPQMAFGRLASG